MANIRMEFWVLLKDVKLPRFVLQYNIQPPTEVDLQFAKEDGLIWVHFVSDPIEEKAICSPKTKQKS